MHNIARVTLFCEKPNVTRASIFPQILLQDNGHLWTKFIECISMNLVL